MEGLTPVVFDASAIIAALMGEPGEAQVREVAAQGAISTVNLSEVVAYFARHGGMSRESISALLGPLPVEPVPFDVEQATIAGLLVPQTRKAGLSLGDRACLALALSRKATVLTADRAWLELGAVLDLDIVAIR